jgi:hypothetical protein
MIGGDPPDHVSVLGVQKDLLLTAFTPQVVEALATLRLFRVSFGSGAHQSSFGRWIT